MEPEPVPLYAPPKTSTDKQLVRKAVISLVFIVALAGVGAGAYFASKPKEPSRVLGSDTETTPSPTDLPLPTEEITPEPTENLSPTLKPTAKPTAKPSATPTSTPIPTSASQTLTINSDASLDGFRASNNGGNDSIEIRAGRNDTLTTRGFVSFSLPDSLKGKTIESATLRLYQYDRKGEPYTAGGTLLAEHMDYGSTLDSADYGASTFSPGTVSLTSNSANEWKDVSVTNWVQADITANHSRSQYRLRFTTESTGGTSEGDFAYFRSSNGGNSDNRPQLVIKYH